LFLSLIVAVSGCGTAAIDHSTVTALGDDAITVGSFNFGESEVLAEIYSQALEAGGYDVERAFRLGTREFVAPALAEGLVELVPEYAGTALQFLSLGHDRVAADVAATHAALVRAAAASGITVLAAAPAQDANTFVVTQATADRWGLRTVSDLAPVAAGMTFGGPPECPGRDLCLAGLEHVYHLSFDAFLALDTGGPLTRQALADGYADVVVLFTTDPAIATGELVALEDDRGLQPAENVTPLIRTEVVDRWGDDVVDRIDLVSRRLTTGDLRGLNAELLKPGATVRRVAAAWLEAEGLT